MQSDSSSKRKIPRWLRRLIYVFLILLTIYIFKGSIYRTCFSYQLVRCRSEKIIGENEPPSKAGKEFPEIIDYALKNSANKLSFTTDKCATDAQSLLQGGKTNCIGYANLCAFYCNDNFSLYGFYKAYKAETYVAQIYLFGFNIHNLFSNPFWKDHDVVVITEINSGKKTILDPTLYDYTGVGFVKER